MYIILHRNGDLNGKWKKISIYRTLPGMTVRTQLSPLGKWI